MSRKKVVIFNAPASVGKDEAVRYCTAESSIWLEDATFHHMMFKDNLYNITAAIYNVSLDWLIDVATNRETKELPSEALMGRTPREALIHTSESVIKPAFGKSYFGYSVAASVRHLDSGLPRQVYLFSDGGFVEEIPPLIEEVGEENIMVVRIYRPGYSFEGDSRNYLLPEQFDHRIKFTDLHNDGTLEEFQNNAYNLVLEFINQ